MNELNGVWADKDREVVITEDVIIKFERSSDAITSYLYLEVGESKEGKYQLKAMARFAPNKETYSLKYRHNITNRVESLGDNLDFDFEPLIFQKRDFLSSGLRKIEDDAIISSFIYLEADKHKIGDCLQDWTLGTSFYKSPDDSSFSASVRTIKHSYIFRFNCSLDRPMIYCRAARIKSTNLGMAFSQNIRLMKNERAFTAFMAEENLKMAASELVIDDSRFLDEECSVERDGNRYWSLKEFTKDRIVLYGCGGDEYVYDRPRS